MLRCLVVVIALSLAPLGAAAQGASQPVTQEQILRALDRQGYYVERITRTLLGRVHIIASRGTVWREIVLNPSSGEILRDFAVQHTVPGSNVPREPHRSSDPAPLDLN